MSSPGKVRRPISPAVSPPSSPLRVKTLEDLWRPKIKLNAFVVKALTMFPKLKLSKVEQAWREKNFAYKPPPMKLKYPRKEQISLSATQRIDTLTDEQQQLLNDLFYRQHKGTLGVRALWEVLREEPQQESALELGDTYISWRNLRAWYNAQETNQIHRKANAVSKTLVNVPEKEDLVPFKYMQLDTLVFAKGNKTKSDDGAYGTKDTDPGLQDNGKRVVYNLIDIATNYNWLNAGSQAPNTDDATVAVFEFVDAVRDHYGAWPRKTIIQVDGGAEYAKEFRDAITEHEPLITFKVNAAYNPNSQSFIEGSQSIFRRIAKRHAENNKANRTGKKPYLSYWFGNKKGEILQELNMLMNTRPLQVLGWQTPADVMEAFMNEDYPDDRDAVITKAIKAKLDSANARRGSAHIKKYKTGDKIRVVSDAYVEKAGMRGNKLKQAPPFSKTIYTISSVQGGLNNVPKYRLENKGKEWFLHHRLQKVADGIALPPPASIVKQLPDYERYDISSKPDRVFYRGFPMGESISNIA